VISDETAAQVRACLENLPEYLGQHVLISALALTVGVVVSLPLAVVGARSKTLRWPTLTAASVIQTIPSMALLALFFPILVGLSALTSRLAGVGLSALGFLPTIVALTLYSMLPILRNTVTAITGVDPAMTEAARGLGMHPRQVLVKVELPLALPVIIAGVRTATVWVVGIATLSAPIGQTSLGTYIFSGLQTRNWIAVLFGCLCAAALALALDQLIGLMQSGVSRRSRTRVLAAAAGLVAVIGGGLALGAVWGGGISPVIFRAAGDEGEGGEYVVGSKTFAEQYILAAVLCDQLADAGLPARKQESLGSAVVFGALAAGEIDCYVDYSGTIWSNYMKRDGPADRATVLREVARWVEKEHGVRCLGPLGFENAYCLAVRRDRARELGVGTIEDLVPRASELTLGGTYEFFGRPEWTSLRERYGLAFAGRRQFQATFMYDAVAGGEVDVIAAFSSDGRIEAYDLVVLDDPKHVIPPYDAVLLVAPGVADDEALLGALRPLIGRIPVETMRQANLMVTRDEGATTVQEAARWLRRGIGLAQD
jgi:osmoprotectant transport system permease protein